MGWKGIVILAGTMGEDKHDPPPGCKPIFIQVSRPDMRPVNIVPGGRNNLTRLVLLHRCATWRSTG